MRFLINDSIELGVQLKRLRELNGFKADLIAKNIGISKSYLSMIESGKRIAHWSLLKKILNAQNETLISFFTKAENNQKPVDENHLTNNFSILIEGESNALNTEIIYSKSKNTTIFLTPFQKNLNCQLVNICLLPKSYWTEDYITYNSKVTLLCSNGSVLFECKDVDSGQWEKVIQKNELLIFDANNNHRIRNHTNETSHFTLIISNPKL
ncbi:MAG: helix-turn-helix domain-containing protein [Chlorobiota bacterium]|nr:helix-turn-helix domain-containing protein [Chlorobiota bacterium]QQS66881.1 MAG: helix-turn-helix domain-containing protein [Chlorobiota bacterium]